MNIGELPEAEQPKRQMWPRDGAPTRAIREDELLIVRLRYVRDTLLALGPTSSGFFVFLRYKDWEWAEDNTLTHTETRPMLENMGLTIREQMQAEKEAQDEAAP